LALNPNIKELFKRLPLRKGRVRTNARYYLNIWRFPVRIMDGSSVAFRDADVAEPADHFPFRA